MFGFATATRVSTTVNRAEVFEAHLRRTSRQAYNLAYRLTGNTAEAEDLVQEAYVRAYRFFDKYDASLPFQSWLYRIISNTHIDLVRRKGRLRTTSLDAASPEGFPVHEVADLESAPDRILLDGLMTEPVQMALDAMNPEFRTAVVLSDVEGMAYEEVAEIMQTSVGTVRSRIHRGRKQLRDQLSRIAPSLVARILQGETCTPDAMDQEGER